MPSSSSTSSYGVGGSAIGSGSAPGAPGSGSGPAGPGAGSQLSYFKRLDILYQYAQFSGDNSSLLGYIITSIIPNYWTCIKGYVLFAICQF